MAVSLDQEQQNRTGKLNFESFCRVALHFNEEVDDEALQKELKEAFRLYDKEGNGFIPISSLREILGALDDQLTGEQLNEMIAEIDTDQSGTVDFDVYNQLTTNTFDDQTIQSFQRIIDSSLNSEAFTDYQHTLKDMKIKLGRLSKKTMFNAYRF